MGLRMVMVCVVMGRLVVVVVFGWWCPWSGLVVFVGGDEIRDDLLIDVCVCSCMWVYG